MIGPLSNKQAHQLRRHYLCGACWSPLVIYFATDRELYLVQCATCGDQTPGYISARFVDRFIAENAAQYQLALAALTDVLPWLKIERHAFADNLKALGF